MGNKRILILGSGDAQLNLIKSAKDLGYYTIVCDMRPEMEGSKIADKYYEQNYMDKSAIYDIAVNERIDGVISNSEPAMINVSFLVDRLRLPGNSTESLLRLLSKTEFRKLQKKCNIFHPESYSVDTILKAIEVSKQLHFPIIVKPSESSGSRGITKISTINELELTAAFNICQQFSRNNMVTLEEFVEMDSNKVINADVFVVGNEFLWDGWYAGLRSTKRPMIPMAKILPPDISEEQELRIKKDVESILLASGVKLGEFNMEAYFSKSGKLFIIEINPRQAGDDIPKLIEEHTGVNLTKLLVSLSVGDRTYLNHLSTYKRRNNYVTMHVVYSDIDGRYNGLHINEKIQPFVNWVNEFHKKGDVIRKADNAEDSLAYVDLHFKDIESQRHFTEEIEKYIYPLIN